MASTLKPRFNSGQIVMTIGVNELVRQDALNPAPYLRRHLSGDWGDLSDNDRRLNNAVEVRRRTLVLFLQGHA